MIPSKKELKFEIEFLAVFTAAGLIHSDSGQQFAIEELRQRGGNPGYLFHGAGLQHSRIEALVIAFATGLTETPPVVLQDVIAGLKCEISQSDIIELAQRIAEENDHARNDIAMKLISDCGVHA